MSARRIVTLPPALHAADAEAHARKAKASGAELVELRTDLHGDDMPVEVLAGLVPLLCSERGRPLPPRWLAHASLVDFAHDAPVAAGLIDDERLLLSCHTEAPLSSSQALRLWESSQLTQRCRHIKHVEPLGAPGDFSRLLETRARLRERFATAQVTVLAMGHEALPFRAVLAEGNALDYLALDECFQAAPGQRLLADAVRTARAVEVLGNAAANHLRLGILGHQIAGSRSPRIHPQPFDRIELREDAPIAALLSALRPHYRGFAVTSPFKQAAARAVSSPEAAVNTLVRTAAGYDGHNTDVDGARAVLERLQAAVVTVLGNGGATVAIRAAAAALGMSVQVVSRTQAAETTFAPSAPVIWTWPSHVDPPSTLALSGAPVAVIAYAQRAQEIAALIRRHGGTPVFLGPRWFIAQARAQRRLWETACETA